MSLTSTRGVELSKGLKKTGLSLLQTGMEGALVEGKRFLQLGKVAIKVRGGEKPDYGEAAERRRVFSVVESSKGKGSTKQEVSGKKTLQDQD